MSEITIKEHLETLMAERDLRYQLMVDSTKEATAIALAARKEIESQFRWLIGIAVTFFGAALTALGSILFYLLTHPK